MKLIYGDCIANMKNLPENSIDCVVTDPPYSIRFMGKSWDGADIERQHSVRNSQAKSPGGRNSGASSIAEAAGSYDLAPEAMLAFQEFSRAWATEAYRVLKPGGHLLSFSSARTYHRMTAGIEDAGFEIRDQIMWLYGSGFPKNLNLEKVLPGWGTALKPAHEPICVARKPLIGTVAANVLQHGTGGINIAGCRVGDAGGTKKSNPVKDSKTVTAFGNGLNGGGVEAINAGRFPANVIHDGSDEIIKLLPGIGEDNAARFFYCAKTSKADREEGLQDHTDKAGGMISNTSGQHITRRETDYVPEPRKNNHPTVKPTALMRYLVRLVCPPGAVCLDPFNGSGSTGKACALEGFDYIGIDMTKEYIVISHGRISVIVPCEIYVNGESVDTELFELLY